MQTVATQEYAAFKIEQRGIDLIPEAERKMRPAGLGWLWAGAADACACAGAATWAEGCWCWQAALEWCLSACTSTPPPLLVFFGQTATLCGWLLPGPVSVAPVAPWLFAICAAVFPLP